MCSYNRLNLNDRYGIVKRKFVVNGEGVGSSNAFMTACFETE